MNTEAMHKVSAESQAGTMTFPEVVNILNQVGVESYYADLVRHENVYYMPSGETHTENLAPVAVAIGENFSEENLVAAIRGAQQDAIRYPEFLRRAMAAGTVAYRVFLNGKRALYFGRKGEIHVEDFPKPKA